MALTQRKSFALAALAVTVALLLLLTPPPRLDAADHFDAPLVDSDQGADIADVFAFVDPNDANKVDLEMTVQGFIMPGEAGTAGAFDPTVRFRFLIENTGDAKPDAFVDVTFAERTSTSQPQTATITLPNGRTFNAPPPRHPPPRRPPSPSRPIKRAASSSTRVSTTIRSSSTFRPSIASSALCSAAHPTRACSNAGATPSPVTTSKALRSASRRLYCKARPATSSASKASRCAARRASSQARATWSAQVVTPT